MQLAGNRFAAATALIGNDLVTLPDFPAEIRAPAGHAWPASRRSRSTSPRATSSRPGGQPNVLVAMNPAALKIEPPRARARRHRDPQRGRVHGPQPAQGRVRAEPARGRHARRLPGVPRPDDLDDRARHRRASTGSPPATRRAPRTSSRSGSCRGCTAARSTSPTRWIEQKFASKPHVIEANLAAFRAGYNFGETAELLQVHYEVKPAPAEPGTYRGVNGTTAAALGLIAASVRSGLPLFLASYPITPASELLHELSRHKRFGVRTVQAEDEIAASNMALGASFGGHLGVTRDERPGDGPEGRDDRPRGRRSSCRCW